MHDANDAGSCPPNSHIGLGLLDVADLKRRLIASWSGLQLHVLDDAIDQCAQQLVRTSRNNGSIAQRSLSENYTKTKIPIIDAKIMYRVGQKSKPANFCNSFVYCQPVFIIFGTYTL